MAFGEDFKNKIVDNFSDVETFVKAVHERFNTDITVDMINESIARDYLFEKCTVYQLHVIAETLGVDYRALCAGLVENKITASYYLEQLDPDGSGADAERALRLAAHAVISYGRACEIMWCDKYNYPKIESTGCNCKVCREMLLYVAERSNWS